MSECCKPGETTCGCSPAPRTLTLTWQRLVSEGGGTCPRCTDTGEAIAQARDTLSAALAPMGIDVTLETQALDAAAFELAPGESNRIWIGGRPLEEWLGASVGATPCCDECGDAECRTVEIDGAVHEAVPADAIVRAGLLAAAELMA